MNIQRFIFLMLKVQSRTPIDLEGIVPETVCRLSELEIAKLPIRQGNRIVELGELFDVRIQNGSENLTLDIQGDCSFVTSIGAGMKAGFLRIHGNVGMHAAARMKGGLLSVSGNASDWFAAEMSGGNVAVFGSCGSRVGAAYPGSRCGMRGGYIYVCDHCGDEVGLLMKRGIIRIRGNCGSFAGRSMIGGTVLCESAIGKFPGAGMKRGTLISRLPIAELSPGFRYCCDYEPTFLPVLRELIYQTHEEKAELSWMRNIRCYRGDLLTGGRGEIWEVLR
jgi:formylmethanofuran dehydrogenase subunit C